MYSEDKTKCFTFFGDPNSILTLEITMFWVFSFYLKVRFAQRPILKRVIYFFYFIIILYHFSLFFFNGLNTIDQLLDSFVLGSICFLLPQIFSEKINKSLILPILNDQLIENQKTIFNFIWFVIVSNYLIFDRFSYNLD